MHISRDRAAKLGQQAVQILQAGYYLTEAGTRVEIAEAMQGAVEGTRSYPPDQPYPQVAGGGKALRLEVANASTLAAARRLFVAGHRPVALNFASAKSPGGGFLSGARAQEESLARSSGLYACLAGHPMYPFHRQQGDPMYTDYAIYSPNVPVFRDEDGALLDQPYLCSFITCPAVNAKVVLERDQSRRPHIREAMRTRILKVLAVAAAHGHEAVVLGAWGCGVFGNDCAEVAELFREALAGPFRGAFGEVVFAILDWSVEARFIGPFQRVFASVPA